MAWLRIDARLSSCSGGTTRQTGEHVAKAFSRKRRLKPRFSQNLLTFSGLVRRRGFAVSAKRALNLDGQTLQVTSLKILSRFIVKILAYPNHRYKFLAIELEPRPTCLSQEEERFSRSASNQGLHPARIAMMPISPSGAARAAHKDFIEWQLTLNRLRMVGLARITESLNPERIGLAI